MKNLTNLYGQLSSDERFVAFISAASRMDLAEMDALNSTCPPRSYLTDDWEYTRRKIRFFDCQLLTMLRLSKIEGALSGLALAAFVGDESDSQRCHETAKKVIATHHTLTQAWRRFCEQIGIDADTSLALLTLYGDDLGDVLQVALGEDVLGQIPEVAPEIVEREVERLVKFWQR